MCFVLFPSDGDADERDQGPIWTFPPTIRPSSLNKLHKGIPHPGSQKVSLVFIAAEKNQTLDSRSGGTLMFLYTETTVLEHLL